MSKIPEFLVPHFRSNHAGETGAIFIYKGILSISKNKEIIIFSKKHLKTEKSHLKKIENLLPKEQRSKFIFLWKILGFLTGFIPGLIGKKYTYATIFAVESFVELHYKEQINLIKNNRSYSQIKILINQLLGDEVEHKNEAFMKIKNLNFMHHFWCKLITIGSITAVKISKII
tara:strand:+ start:172 stop:690 length:519 start_codon:yes stop_codon:yes gene_type:complete